MKPKRDEDLTTRIIKNFSDILILKYLKISPLSSGYEILRHLHEKYKITFSPGTIYHEIYLLERKKCLRSEGDEGGRVYSLTAEGEQSLADIFGASKQISQLVSDIFSET
ncbi:MAG: PadR family transcriptional regulator [Candidatus Bathyarchaeota archaeon]|nr:PadR family transcriptional regulator [Candidatus Bathyarchaeota archaeon]